MRRLQALIFDVDGTLAETEDAHRDAFNQSFAEFGLGWVWDRPLYGRLLSVAGGKERIRAFAGNRPVAEDVVARLHARKTELYTARVAAGGVPLRPGVAALIGQARTAGLRLAIATTTSRANVLALLDGAVGAEGRNWFECMVCAEDAPVKKPAPDAYRLVLERLNLPGAACLAIEDSDNGVRAAWAAGIPVVVTESQYFRGIPHPLARAVWPSLDGITLEQLVLKY